MGVESLGPTYKVLLWGLGQQEASSPAQRRQNILKNEIVHKCGHTLLPGYRQRLCNPKQVSNLSGLQCPHTQNGSNNGL